MSLPASHRSSRLRAVVPPMRLLRLTEATRTATDLPGSARSGLHGWGSSSGRGCLGGEGVPQDIQRVRRGVLLSFALSGEHAADQLEPGVEVVVELDDAEAAAAWQATAERPLADRSGHDHAAVDQVGAQQAQAVVDVVDLGGDGELVAVAGAVPAVQEVHDNAGGGDDQRQDAQPLGADPAVGKAAVVEVGEQRQGVAVPLDDVVAGGDVGLACWGGEPAAQQVDLVAVELFPELPGADVDDLEVDLAFAELVADPWPDPAQVDQRELVVPTVRVQPSRRRESWMSAVQSANSASARAVMARPVGVDRTSLPRPCLTTSSSPTSRWKWRLRVSSCFCTLDCSRPSC